MENNIYNVHSEFDLKKHKEKFINYLEVVIEPNGKIHYAVPSHQLFLEKYGAKINNISQEDFVESCPTEYWGDYLNWLINETNCVSVWSIGYMKPETITEEQIKVLNTFIEEEIMKDRCINC